MIQELIQQWRNEIAILEAALRVLALDRSEWLDHARVQLAMSRGWLGKSLALLGSPNPYPQSDNPNSDEVKPPAYEQGSAPESDDTLRSLKSLRRDIQVAIDTHVYEGPMNGELKVLIDRHVERLIEAKMAIGEHMGQHYAPNGIPGLISKQDFVSNDPVKKTKGKKG